MNQRVVTGLLTAGCIALAGAGYMTYKNQDRTAPEIKVDQSEKIAYTEGEDYGKLLEGVTAQDNKDGDLTSEVFVEKVVPVSKKKAAVYYGVTDKAKNVGTASREVTYQAAEDSDAAEETAPDTASEEASEDATQKTKKKSKKAKAKKTAKDKKAEETAQDAVAADEQSADQQSGTLQPNGTRPAMKLAEEAKTIARGTSFNALNEVTDAVDDKDDRDTLFRGLHIDGTYNVNQAGTYTLQYYVQDSDGNTSDPITFTLTVQ
jgi:flagellar biosynthesis GTPase FlhF